MPKVRVVRKFRKKFRLGGGLSKVKKDVRNLKAMVNKTIENKQQTVNSEINAVRDFPMARHPTLLLTQGAADGDDRPSAARIGNSVTLMRTQLNLSLKISTGVTNCRCRLIVVESVNGNEQLDMDDVLQAGGGAISGTDDTTYISQYTTKTGTNKRYKLHYDKVVNLSTYDRAFFIKKLNIRYGKSGRVINYDGNSSAPTDYNLQIFAIADQTLLAAAPNLAYSMRSVYKDA